MRQTRSQSTVGKSLTTQEVLAAINVRRPLSRTGLRGLLIKVNISPMEKTRTRPLHYPPDTPNRILDALGEKVVTMAQLRAVKRQAQKARAA